MKDKRKAEFLEHCDFFYENNEEADLGTLLLLDYFGFERCLPSHSYGPHMRNDYVIHVVIDGKGVLDHGAKRWQIQKGQMFILYPGEVNTYCADNEEPWYYCWIGFHGKSASKIVEQIGFTKSSPVLTFDNIEEAEKIIVKMLSIRDIELSGRLKRNAGMMMLFSEMVAENARESGMDSNQSMITYAEYAVRYINNHFFEKIRIQDLADKIGISRSYLVKLMKQETGMSPQEFLIETRMRRASDLLTRSNDPVRNVAAECGYDDALAFSKVFKARFGQNPSEYRTSHIRKRNQDFIDENMFNTEFLTE